MRVIKVVTMNHSIIYILSVERFTKTLSFSVITKMLKEYYADLAIIP